MVARINFQIHGTVISSNTVPWIIQDKLVEKEKQKSNSNVDDSDILLPEDYLNSPQFDALDSLNRIDELIADGDLECLNSIITTKNNDIKEIVEKTLKQLKDKGTLLDFSIIINKDKYKVGLPKHKDLLDEIYLYNGDETFRYNEVSLKQQIDAIQKNVPWLYIYIVPDKHIENNKKLIEDVLDTLAEKIAERVRERLQELFPNSQICAWWILYNIHWNNKEKNLGGFLCVK